MIPRTIHQIWIGGEMPADLAGYVDTWRTHHPTWTFHLWGDDDLAVMPMRNREIYDRAEQIAPGSVEQFRSDVARYEILHQLGGVYVDADFECKRPLDDLLVLADERGRSADTLGCFAAWESEPRWVNNAIMGARPLHPLLARLVAGLGANIAAVKRRDRRARPNKLSGPQYLTRILDREMQSMAIFAQSLFYPYLWNELDRQGESFPDAYAVHHWHNRRRRQQRARSSR